MINIKDFDPILVKSRQNVIQKYYYIGYIFMKDFDHVKINSVNLLYIFINEVDGSFLKEMETNI